MTSSENSENFRTNRLHFAHCSTDYTLNTRCIRQSPAASYIRAVSYLPRWLFLLFWALCTHSQLNPFYHPFYPDVTHVRKDTRPSPVCVLIATESWMGPGNTATFACYSIQHTQQLCVGLAITTTEFNNYEKRLVTV